jgi:uncharacterized protein YdhG (YjbR/CyaY superfamily)
MKGMSSNPHPRPDPLVDDYIAAAPTDQQPALRELRAMIRAALPGAVEAMSSARFPVYEVQGVWAAGFASRRKSPMLYIMDAGLLSDFEGRLQGLRTGNSCIEWRENKHLTLDQLRALTFEVLAEAARRLAATRP